MKTIPDHPEIQWAERTGYPSWMQGCATPEPDEDHDYEERREKELYETPKNSRYIYRL